jgi:hypothetical protein
VKADIYVERITDHFGEPKIKISFLETKIILTKEDADKLQKSIQVALWDLPVDKEAL